MSPEPKYLKTGYPYKPSMGNWVSSMGYSIFVDFNIFKKLIISYGQFHFLFLLAEIFLWTLRGGQGVLKAIHFFNIFFHEQRRALQLVIIIIILVLYDFCVQFSIRFFLNVNAKFWRKQFLMIPATTATFNRFWFRRIQFSWIIRLLTDSELKGILS